ncbi:MAG: hypothetical protein CVV06_01185 [Gammaproteobacteria bacterium HGW-Gammaproteobacteria-10]|nr:MAG: hypothetical protein CVV06_01185 [Gammaproteobacteria bacterium HGW-Gammaproteobacteria-10]
MKFLKQIVIALAVALSVGSFSQVMAAGKIENATPEEVGAAIASAAKNSEDALAALKNGEADETVLELIEAARQDSKRIEVGRLDVKRTRAAAHLKNARSAIRKGDKTKAEASLIEAVKGYQEVKAEY